MLVQQVEEGPTAISSDLLHQQLGRHEHIHIHGPTGDLRERRGRDVRFCPSHSVPFPQQQAWAIILPLGLSGPLPSLKYNLQAGLRPSFSCHSHLNHLPTHILTSKPAHSGPTQTAPWGRLCPVSSITSHLAQERPEDGRPLALHQAFLISSVALQEVPKHQEKGGHCIPLHPFLCRPPGRGQRLVKSVPGATTSSTIPTTIPRRSPPTAGVKDTHLKTCPGGEAGPECYGLRSVPVLQGRAFHMDLPRPPEAAQPLAPARAAGHPCPLHSSPHPGRRGSDERAVPSQHLALSLDSKYRSVELVSQTLPGPNSAPLDLSTHTHTCTYLHIPRLHPMSCQAAIQTMAGGQVQTDIVLTGLDHMEKGVTD